MSIRIGLAVIPCVFGLGTAVSAQSAETNSNQETSLLEAVVVTGSRLPTEVAHVAASMSVVDEQQIREQLGIDNNVLATLDALVPGLTLSQGEFRNGCRMNIR